VPENFESYIEFQIFAYAILENGSPDLLPGDLESPEIVNISLDGNTVPIYEKIVLTQDLNMKILEVTVRSPQGMGSTCQVKEYRK
jgi:hypothetical protein